MSPMKPTREDAARASRPEELGEKALSPEEKLEAAGHGHAEGRQERGGTAGNGVHPPHVTENAEGAPVQDERPGDVEPLPANASGHERIPGEEVPRGVRPESAYEGRRDEDKDRPPTTRKR